MENRHSVYGHESNISYKSTSGILGLALGFGITVRHYDYSTDRNKSWGFVLGWEWVQRT